MKTQFSLNWTCGLAMMLTLASLSGCGITSHAVVPSTLGKVSSSTEMESMLAQPGPVELTAINSVNWTVPLSGMVNLNNPIAQQAQLKDRDEPIHVYVHVLKHPKYGNFLVDTGVAQQLIDDPDKAGVSWIVAKVMHLEKMKLQTSTDDVLRTMPGQLSGVFFTHLHIDHISGMPAIPNDVPLYIGKSETTGKNWINMFVFSSTNNLLAHKQNLQEWNFEPDPQHQFDAVVDVFGDGSVFAISVPGHTPGSVAYLVRSTKGPVLLTGDTSHTRWGWDHGVEPGDFTNEQAENLVNLMRLKALVARHPEIVVRLGHQD
ncbi:MBL fold metallo-hydrolase [Solimicrobium silvestre]|uniref:Metallo-beta-lactamase superfamily n=1 Tax=Solimicrobium silvestre TaxID=2099400 RepID=A0A2S9GZ15_9BURK|nr:MBL fold metallo-hydrolase [Solimicrobium silvestre]PRC92947.1 Metallo-beta-lactamase superfamily [Solimicrobium silvestre]